MSLLYCIAKWMEHVDNLVLPVTLRIIIISGFQHWRIRELCRHIGMLSREQPLVPIRGLQERLRLSWLTNSALVNKPRGGERGGVAGCQPISTAVHRSPNKLWRSNSIFNLWCQSGGHLLMPSPHAWGVVLCIGVDLRYQPHGPQERRHGSIRVPEPVLLNVYGARNWFQGMNSASLCSLAGRYDYPIPPRFL